MYRWKKLDEGKRKKELIFLAKNVNMREEEPRWILYFLLEKFSLLWIIYFALFKDEILVALISGV